MSKMGARWLRSNGLAIAVGALVAVALTAGSASATVFCESSTNGCPEEKTLKDGAVIEGEQSGINVVITNNIETVTCSKSGWSGSITTNKRGEFNGGVISTWSFSSCTTPANTCAVTALGAPYELTGAGSAGAGDGFLGFGNKAMALEVKCGTPAVIECTLSLAPEVETEIIGGKPATALIERFIPAEALEGNICPKGGLGALLEAEYEVTEPAEFFIVSKVSGAALCKSSTASCPGAYPIGTSFKGSIKAKTKFVYEYGETKREPECNTSTFEGETTASGAPLIGELTSLTFGGCGAGVCEITAQRLPYGTELDNWIFTDDGTTSWRSGGGGKPAVKINCGGLLEECTYGVDHFTWDLKGGTTAEVFWPTKVSLTLESGSALLCSAGATWEGVSSQENNWEITTPSPLYLRAF